MRKQSHEMLLHVPEAVVEFAGNTYCRVPIILQVDDDPLIECVSTVSTGYTAQFKIFNSGGDYLAKVTGTRMFLTDAGRRANLRLRYPDKMTVCELDGTTLFEVRRTEAAALKVDAELFAASGTFVRCDPSINFRRIVSQSATIIADTIIRGSKFVGSPIAIFLNTRVSA